VDAIDAAQQQIDIAETFLRIDTQRALLARRRNALLAVSRLPPEIVATIFRMASTRRRVRCSVTRWIEEWRPFASDPLVAIVLSHVSDAFRDVALATATLWSTIDTMYGKTLVRQLLERARRAPITVGVQSYSSSWSLSFLVEVLAKKCPVVRHLWLPKGHKQEGMDSLLRQIRDRPALRSLHLDVANQPGRYLEQCNLQQLETLCLDGPGSAMSRSLPSPLLHLTKVALNLRYLEPDDTTRVLCFLSNVPALDELNIGVDSPGDANEWSGLPNIAQDLTYPEPSLHLLRRIRLAGPYICTVTLLYHMHFGPACGIELIPDITEPMHRSMGVLKRFLHRHPFGQDGVVAVFMRSTVSPYGTDAVKWELHSKADPHSTGGNTVLEFKEGPEHTGDIARAIQWDGLRDLTVDVTNRKVADILFAATRSLRALASVTVGGHDTTRCFCKALLRFYVIMMATAGAWGHASRVSWKSTTTTARIALPFDLYPDPLSDCRVPYQ
jgi:hypothetical protein